MPTHRRWHSSDWKTFLGRRRRRFLRINDFRLRTRTQRTRGSRGVRHRRRPLGLDPIAIYGKLTGEHRGSLPGLPPIILFAQHLAVLRDCLSAFVPRRDMIRFHLLRTDVRAIGICMAGTMGRNHEQFLIKNLAGTSRNGCEI